MQGFSTGGKGDTPRPITDRKQYESNWDMIFRKKEVPQHQEKKDASK